MTHTLFYLYHIPYSVYFYDPNTTPTFLVPQTLNTHPVYAKDKQQYYQKQTTILLKKHFQVFKIEILKRRKT